MNANCTKCQQQTIFELNDKKQYKCQKCNSTMHKCHNKDCINMISVGLYCSKCVGRGLKKAGAGAGVVLGGISILGIKYVGKKKGKR